MQPDKAQNEGYLYIVAYICPSVKRKDKEIMSININLELDDNKLEDMMMVLKNQEIAPYYESRLVNAVLETFPKNSTFAFAISMYFAGYIDGKRAERAKRKRGLKA